MVSFTSVSAPQEDWAQLWKRSASRYRRPQSLWGVTLLPEDGTGSTHGDVSTGVALGNSLHTGALCSASESK